MYQLLAEAGVDEPQELIEHIVATLSDSSVCRLPPKTAERVVEVWGSNTKSVQRSKHITGISIIIVECNNKLEPWPTI